MNPFVIAASIVIFVLLLWRADTRLTVDQRQQLDGALKGVGDPEASGWTVAFCIALSPWFGREAPLWRRFLNGCLASAGLYFIFSIILWATSGFATAALVYLGFMWLMFGMTIGWPKDVLVISQVRRLALITEALRRWEAPASAPLRKWMARLLRIGGHLLVLIILSAFVGACLVGLQFAATAGYEFAGWDHEIVDIRDRLFEAWGQQTLPGVFASVPATRAGYELLIGMTLIPVTYFYLFGICWFWVGSLTRSYYRIRRRVPSVSATARPLMLTAFVGLPLGLPLTLLTVLLLPAILIAVILTLAIAPLRVKKPNAVPA